VVGVNVSVGMVVGVLVSGLGCDVTGSGVLHPVKTSKERNNTVMKIQIFFIVASSN